MTVRSDLIKVNKSIKKMLDDIPDGYEPTDEDQKAYEELLQSVDLLKTTITDSRESKISEFFEEIGKGIVSAQRRLDQQSIEYNNARLSVASPTSFRIPKVDAEIKFAISKSESAGFNVLLFGSKSTASQSQQNSVKFEIAAVPPPPDHMRSIPLQSGFVTSYEARTYIQIVTLDIIRRKEVKIPEPIQKYIQEEFDKILVVVNEAGRWLLLFERLLKDSTDTKAITGVTVDVENDTVESATFDKDGSILKSTTGRFNLIGNFFRDILASQIKHVTLETD